MAYIFFGEISGVIEGDTFQSRKELSKAGVHRPLQGGIDGNSIQGTSSIVLSGGYLDDEDHGNEIIYTGHGGNDSNGRRIKDQSWYSYGNRGLLISELHGHPVRVTRGANHISKFSPKKGYQYGGLYQVTEHFWKKDEGKFGVCIFKLAKISALSSTDILKGIIDLSPENGIPSKRIPTTILRIVRDTKLSKAIKELYNYTCQVCGIRISFNGIGYAEGAHIRPLGTPHNGADAIGNLLCLCPNHHVMYDKGYFRIDENFSLIGINGSLSIHKNHQIDIVNIKYHCDLFNFEQ